MAIAPFVLSVDAARYRLGAEALSQASYRLTTGSRIIHTGDDPGAVLTAAGLQNQFVTDRAGRQNGASAQSLLQVAQEGLSRIQLLLETLQGLATTATDAGLSANERGTVNAQFQGGLEAIDAIAQQTQFNGISLLDGSIAAPGGLNYGLGGDQSVTVQVPQVTSAELFAGGGTDLSSTTNATDALASVTVAQQRLTTAATAVAAYAERLDGANGALLTTLGGLTTAKATLLDLDEATAQTSFVREFLQQNTAAAVLAQSQNLSSGLLGLL